MTVEATEYTGNIANPCPACGTDNSVEVGQLKIIRCQQCGEGLLTFGPPKTVEMEIEIVPDESIACPGCGAYWGNPDKLLDFPNRFKVDTFCRCYNPNCQIAYYDPYSGETEMEVPHGSGTTH